MPIEDWFVDPCPNCETRNFMFWNSQGIWCLKCRWVRMNEPVEEETDIPEEPPDG